MKFAETISTITTMLIFDIFFSLVSVRGEKYKSALAAMSNVYLMLPHLKTLIEINN